MASWERQLRYLFSQVHPTALGTDVWGTQKVTQSYSLDHGLFTFDIPASMWLMYENGVEVFTSTDITSINGIATLLTTNTNTELLLESRDCRRYQPNRGHLFSPSIFLPNKNNSGIRDFGLFTAENGVYFRLKSDGKLYAVLKTLGVETHEEEIDLSVLKDFDIEKGNIYDIRYQWRGVGNYEFYIGNPFDGIITLVHEIKNLSLLDSLSMANPALPMAFRAERINDNVQIGVGCSDVSSEGGTYDTEQHNSAGAENVTVSTNTPVIVLKQPLQINGTTNTRSLTLARITFNCSKKAVFKVWETRDSSAITGATFATFKAGSFVECDSIDMNPSAVRATSVNTSLLEYITTVNVEAGSREPVDNPARKTIRFSLVRGDYLVITCTAASAQADVVVEWGEQI